MVFALVLANLIMVAANIHLVKVLLAQKERRLLLKLCKYRSTKLGRLYRQAVGKKAGDVLAFPNQHYINHTLVA